MNGKIPKDIFIDRELSWIDFNLRVLQEVECAENPLFEKANFVSIFQSNFAEFFRVRVGTLYDEMIMESDEKLISKTAERLDSIFRAVKRAVAKLDEAYDGLRPQLAEYFEIVSPEEVNAEEKAYLKQRFIRDIAPIISPFIVEKKHPFPFFDNGMSVVGVTLSGKAKSEKFGFIPITDSLPKVVRIEGDNVRFMLIEDVLKMFSDKVFGKFEIKEKIVFSIIRNADIDANEGLYDYDVDFREKMSKLIELRQKLAPVCMKYNGRNCEKILSHLRKVLFLQKKQVFCQTTPMSMKFMKAAEQVYNKQDYPELYYTPAAPQYPKALKRGSIINHIQRYDVLLSYPYDDISALCDLLFEAANSGRVREICISLYRVAKNSKIVQLLIDAAKNGVKVSCVVELRARFDEENNIDWSVRLEEAGCKVYYGLPNYKVHCKLLYIGMKDGGKDIVQVGTGNFNEQTARLYTDLALFTSHSGIVKDAKRVFNCLKNGVFVEQTSHLLVAPLLLKSGIVSLIDEQICAAQSGKSAEISVKMNSLTDKALMKKLIEASQAGVKIKLLIRGICCLKPGVKGYTENIQVHSIVGRFLEHSRIYVFGVGKNKKYYISSADFMTRNTDQRVEVAAPVYSYSAKRRLAHIMRLAFEDNVKARELGSDGKYRYYKNSQPAVNLQNRLYDEAYAKNNADKK